MPNFKYKDLKNKIDQTLSSCKGSNYKVYILTFLFCCIHTVYSYSQSGELAVDSLVKLGFENVSWTESENERIYVMENIAYRLNGIGIGKAVDVVQTLGLPEQKSCRLIFLDNNVPQISLCYKPILGDSVPEANRSDWKVSYDLGADGMKAIKGKKKNSSLFKVDVVIYPELSFKNLILTQVYQVLFNLCPAIEVSLWNGMKLTGQIVIPIYNDYGSRYDKIHQGYVGLTQSFRLPQNIFVTASVGTFNINRWGIDVRAKRPFKDERFFAEGRIGYTGYSAFENWRWQVGNLKRLTWNIGGGFYWDQYNTQFSVKLEQYLLGEKGVRFDMTRYFRYAAIGFYAMKVDVPYNNGVNGGFRFQIALPPFKNKRKGYLRVTPSKSFGIVYNAANEQYYGKSYSPQLGNTIMQENSFNPYFIKSELSNY